MGLIIHLTWSGNKKKWTSDWKILKHSTKGKARSYMRHYGYGFSSISAYMPVCAWSKARKFGFTFSSIIHLLKVLWSYFVTMLHKWKLKFIASLPLLIFNLISHHIPSSDPIRLFSSLHTFLGSKRAWSMNIYHDLWFVSRFEDKMLIFQASRLKCVQTVTELYSKQIWGASSSVALQQDLCLCLIFYKA